MNNELEFMKLDVQGRLGLMRERLLQQDPMLPVHLAAIHGALIQYEELVHLLSDEDIKTLVAGQSKHVGVKLTEEILKTKKSTLGPKIPKNTADDF